MVANVRALLLGAVFGWVALQGVARAQEATPQQVAPGAVAPLAAGEGQPAARPMLHSRITQPVVLFMAAPEYSREARKKRISGDVDISLTVDAAGHPENVQVTHGLGSGLDEQAVKAVQKYRFKPAMEDGVPVASRLSVKVTFQVF